MTTKIISSNKNWRYYFTWWSDNTLEEKNELYFDEEEGEKDAKIVLDEQSGISNKLPMVHKKIHIKIKKEDINILLKVFWVMEMKIKDDKLLYLLKIYPIKYDDYFSLTFDKTKK